MMVTTLQCPSCGTLNDEGVEWCRSCRTFLPWSGARADTRPSTGLALRPSATTVAVVPGADASLDLTIQNTGRIVDRVTIDLDGTPGAWSVAEPGTLSLFPGDSANARVVLRPARDPGVSAGRQILTIRARSATDPEVVAAQEVTVDVAPFDDLHVRMTPETSRGTTEGVHRVVVENRGNHPMTVTLESRDPDGAGEVGVTFEPPVADLAAGARVAVTALVHPARPLTGGPAQPRSFQVVARAAGVDEVVLDGVMLQESVPAPLVIERRRRRWLPVVIAALVALVGVVGAVAAFAGNAGDDNEQAGVNDPPVVVDDQAPDGAQPAPDTPPAPPGEEPAAALADLAIADVQCAAVPSAREVRFVVQLANAGGALDGPATVTVAGGDVEGRTEVAIDRLAVANLAVPLDQDLLGRQIEFTVAVDPDEAVEEADESNNARVVAINFPRVALQPVALCR